MNKGVIICKLALRFYHKRNNFYVQTDTSKMCLIKFHLVEGGQCKESLKGAWIQPPPRWENEYQHAVASATKTRLGENWVESLAHQSEICFEQKRKLIWASRGTVRTEQTNKLETLNLVHISESYEELSGPDNTARE